jgi:NAD-dependent dihydropyrimidine dehydrogenase PreA subunit
MPNTSYINLDTHKCKACWECVEKCKNKVFEKVNVFFHKHTVIKNADKCTGCLKCLKACKYGAIFKIS